MGNTQHYQCGLRRGNSLTIGWVPARAAKLDAVVEVITDGVKEDWTVVAVYGNTSLSEDVIKADQRDARTYAKRTDI